MSELSSQNTQDERLAQLIEQERLATVQRFGVPLWMLTTPVDPSMQEAPAELDAEEVVQ